MPYSQGAQAALLQWINAFELSCKVESLHGLTDGTILSEILRDLDPEFDASAIIHNPSSWQDSRRNLDLVWRGLGRFMARQDNVPARLVPSPSQFRAFTQNPDVEGVCEFVSSFVAAAFLGPDVPKYASRIQGFDTDTQSEIAFIIKKKQQEGQSVNSHAAVEPPPSLAADLALEEELARKTKQLDIMVKKNADILTQNEQLHGAKEDMKLRLQELQSEVDELRRAQNTGPHEIIQELVESKRAQDDLIDGLQAEVEELRTTKERLERKNELLSWEADRIKLLEDEIEDIKSENDILAKKANAAERFKQKLDSMLPLEKRNRALQDTVDNLSKQLLDQDRLQHRVAQLELTHEQFLKSIESYEQHFEDERQQKDLLRSSLEHYKRQQEILEEKNMILENLNRDLQDDRLEHVYGPKDADSPREESAALNLEDELKGSHANSHLVAPLQMEVQRLRAENQLLRNNVGVASENERLRGEVSRLRQKNKMAEEKLNQAQEQHVVAQEQINALLSSIPIGERDSAYRNLYRQLQRAKSEHDKLESELRKFRAELADHERDLLAARAERDAAGLDTTSALEVLKSSDELISHSLRTELDAMRQHVSTLDLELEQTKSQLMEALLSREGLRKQVEVLRAPSGSPTLANTPAASTQDTVEALGEMLTTVKKLRAHLKQKVEQLQQADNEKYELQRAVKALESGAGLASMKAQYELTIKNLRREIGLMSSAWHDLSGRLQSNHVVLQRRQDMPKSWIQKSRLMVNATPRR